jgi:hypothetical protein
MEWAVQGRNRPCVLPSSPLLDVSYASISEAQPRDPEEIALFWQEDSLHLVLTKQCGLTPGDAVGAAFSHLTSIEERIRLLENMIKAMLPDGDDDEFALTA